jgi:hypothetical protein
MRVLLFWWYHSSGDGRLQRGLWVHRLKRSDWHFYRHSKTIFWEFMLRGTGWLPSITWRKVFKGWKNRQAYDWALLIFIKSKSRCGAFWASAHINSLKEGFSMKYSLCYQSVLGLVSGHKTVLKNSAFKDDFLFLSTTNLRISPSSLGFLSSI